MQYIVHIGVNKTGTSSLQSAFHGHRARLTARGIVYPDIGIDLAAHHNLSRVVKGARPAAVGLPEDWPAAFAAVVGDARLCVLSSEDFATIPDPAPLARICPPGQTRIVVYVREHVAHAASWYQQAVQSQNLTMSLRDFAERGVADYCGLVDRWAAVYGAEAVILRHYDRAQLVAGDVVADFAELVEPGLAALFAGKTYDANPSLSGNLLFLKRLLNAFLTREEARAIVHEAGALTVLDPGFRGKMAVDAETVTRIRHLSRADREGLATRFGIHLAAPHGALKGHACPDHGRLAADFAQIRDHAAHSKPGIAAALDRLIGMVGRLPSSSSPKRTSAMTDKAADPKKTLELDTARALFAARNPGLADEAARKEGWLAQKEQCRKEARVLLRRLELAGYSIAKG